MRVGEREERRREGGRKEGGREEGGKEGRREGGGRGLKGGRRGKEWREETCMKAPVNSHQRRVNVHRVRRHKPLRTSGAQDRCRKVRHRVVVKLYQS